MTYTPKIFKNGDLTLEYNRFVMKKPSSLLSTTPSPTGVDLKQLGSEESYIPKIAAHTRSWPSFLARNFFHLTNIKLTLTFLINMILLTYQVSVLCIVDACTLSVFTIEYRYVGPYAGWGDRIPFWE